MTDRTGAVHGQELRSSVSKGITVFRRASNNAPRRLPVLAALAALALCACGSDGPEDGEDYGDLLASPQGLVLVQEEHPAGWTRPECFACHEPRNAHIVNRTSLPDCADVAPNEACVDLPGIRELVHDEGQNSCVLCHGTNGVAP